MNNKRVFAGILVGLSIIAGTSLAAPAEARSDANWAANQMAVQMYQQNMATQAQLQQQMLAQQQAQAYYQQQQGLINQAQLAANANYSWNPFGGVTTFIRNHERHDGPRFDHHDRNGWRR